ncbi:MAG TPA: helix-hairpin-helix domain-containing protein [Candidatus Elarobacter sp.]|nr:helix-hairpin-helix domain-containing protein [Candidatus Elarobacter sp.]
MKQYLPVLVAAAVGAFVLLRPLPPPAATTAGAGAWSVADSGLQDKHGRRTPPPRAMVYVAGEVVRAGVYPVGPEARVRDALALAGGAKAGADLVAVNLAAHVADGDEIVVPVRGAEPASSATAGLRSGRRRRRGHRQSAGFGDVSGGALSAGRPDSRGSGSARTPGEGKRRRGHARGAPPPAGQIDVNTADADTLATIPGIGGGLAERIVAFREANGPFASVDELLDVAGITDRRLEAILPYVVAR